MKQKRKLLYITELFPYPADSGGTIKTLNTLQTLSTKYEVFLICFSARPLKSFQKTYIKKYVKKYECFILPQIDYSEKQAVFHVLLGYIKGIPHLVSRYTSSSAHQRIQHIISNYRPDIIHIDHINMAYYLPSTKKQLWVFEEQNIEHELINTQLHFAHNFKRKVYYFIEKLLTYQWETRWFPRFDHIFCISEVDLNRLATSFEMKKLSVFPIVYPLGGQSKKRTKHSLLFIGGLNWPPNADAILWFINHVLPKIKKVIPGLEFHVIGEKNIFLENKLIKTDGVFFHGYQKNPTPFLKKASLFVLPFRMGGGVRVKALTAMSAGIPIVTTALGVMGLGVTDEKEVLQNDTDNGFAKNCVRVLASSKLSLKLRLNSNRYLTRNHSKQNNKKFLQTYSKLVISA